MKDSRNELNEVGQEIINIISGLDAIASQYNISTDHLPESITELRNVSIKSLQKIRRILKENKGRKSKNRIKILCIVADKTGGYKPLLDILYSIKNNSHFSELASELDIEIYLPKEFKWIASERNIDDFCTFIDINVNEDISKHINFLSGKNFIKLIKSSKEIFRIILQPVFDKITKDIINRSLEPERTLILMNTTTFLYACPFLSSLGFYKYINIDTIKIIDLTKNWTYKFSHLFRGNRLFQLLSSQLLFRPDVSRYDNIKNLERKKVSIHRIIKENLISQILMASPQLIPDKSKGNFFVPGQAFFKKENDPLPESIDKFLFQSKEQNKKIGLLSFGSMCIQQEDKKKILNGLIDAARDSDFTLIIQNIYGESDNTVLFYVGSFSHQKVFEQVDFVITHAGAGTINSIFIEGKPIITIPFFADQYYWPEKLKQIGCLIENIPYKKLRKLSENEIYDFFSITFRKINNSHYSSAKYYGEIEKNNYGSAKEKVSDYLLQMICLLDINDTIKDAENALSDYMVTT